MQKSFSSFLLVPLLTLTIASLLSLSTQSCKKQDDSEPNPPQFDSLGLPYPTQIGRGAFGFLLNDSIWMPGCGSWIDPSGVALYVDRAQIDANNYCVGTGKKLHMTMPPFVVGEYSLDDQGFDAYYIDYDTPGPAKSYLCSFKAKARSRFVISYYNQDKQILSGTFHIVLYRNNETWLSNVPLGERDQHLDLSDSIIISNGRFDVTHR